MAIEFRKRKHPNSEVAGVAYAVEWLDPRHQLWRTAGVITKLGNGEYAVEFASGPRKDAPSLSEGVAMLQAPVKEWAAEYALMNREVIAARREALIAQGFTEGTAQGFSEVELNEMLTDEFGPNWEEALE